MEDFEKASLAFHLLEKNILCQSWSGISLLQRQQKILEIMKDYEKASLVFHLLEKNYLVKIVENLNLFLDILGYFENNSLVLLKIS